MITKAYSQQRYLCDGITKIFNFDFDLSKVYGEDQIVVFLKTISTGIVVTLIKNQDYTLDFANKIVATAKAYSDAYSLIIARSLPYEQPYSFETQGLTQKKQIEASDDFGIMIDQQIKDGLPGLMKGYDEATINADFAEGQKHLSNRIDGLDQSKISKATIPLVVTDVNVQSSVDSAELVLELKNTDTGETSTSSKTMPMADETRAGIMPKESFAQINKNTEDIAAHDGLLTYLPGHDFGTATPSQDDFNNYALSVGKTQPFQNSLAVRNLYNGVEWIYNAADNKWVPYGQGDVPIATNDSLGIAKGSLDDNGVRVGNDGSMTVPGLGSKAKKDLSDATISPEFQSLLAGIFANKNGDNIAGREFLKNLGIEIGTFYSRNDAVPAARVQMSYIRIKKFYSDDKDLLILRNINYFTWYGTGGAWNSDIWRIPPFASASPAPTVDYQVLSILFFTAPTIRLLENLQTAFRWRLPSSTPNTGGLEVCYRSTTPTSSDYYSNVFFRILDMQIDTNLIIAAEY